PQYDRVSDFSAIGVAAVQKDGHWQLIDRDGQPLSIDLGPAVEYVHVDAGQPALIRVSHGTTYLDANGQPVDIPADISVLGPYGDTGLLIAVSHSLKGILDSDYHWLL